MRVEALSTDFYRRLLPVEFHTACALFRAGLRGTSPPGPPSPPLAAVGQRLDRLEAALGKRVRDLEEEVRKLKASRNN